MKKISIIIPIYNLEKYIDNCLSTLIEIDSNLVEIILVDDGSIDNSSYICKKYSEKYDNIHYYYQNNSGPSAARNLGITKSSGKFIVFIDGDDYIDYDNFIKVINNLDEENDDIIMSCSYYEKEKNRITKKEYKLNAFEYNSNNLVEEYLEKDYPFFGYVWLNIYKRDVINNILFDNELRFGEDTDWNLRVLLSDKLNIKINCIPYYYYRKNRLGSLVNKKAFNNVINYYAMLEKWFKYAEDKELIYVKRFFAMRFFDNLKYAYDYNKQERKLLLSNIKKSKYLLMNEFRLDKIIIKICGLNISMYMFNLFKNIKCLFKKIIIFFVGD